MTLTVTEAHEHVRPYPTTGYDRRSYGNKPRLYVHASGESIMENLAYRRNRPTKLYKEVLPVIFMMLGLPEDTRAVWSWKAGCSCGCSPGFVLDGVGGQRDFWATVVGDGSKVEDTPEAMANAADRIAQLDRQGIVDLLRKKVDANKEAAA